jgi:shikimate dehydrogenase
MMRKACVIGHPIGHSRSPVIHGHWLKTHGIEGSYTREDIAPADFATFLESMPERGFVGGNATLPHKQALLSLARERSPAADAIGAANTFWFDDGRLCCDNTDMTGFLANLDHGAPGWDKNPDTALVLGAGGAARGMIYGLIQRGFERVIVANRTRANAEDLGRDFGGAIVPIDWRDAARFTSDADLLVNTTSLGMEGQGALEMDISDLPSHAVVTDAVYAPLETDLLVRARLRGLATVGGLGMLLHQAVPGFARWFGAVPTVTQELHDLVAADLAREH